MSVHEAEIALLGFRAEAIQKAKEVSRTTGRVHVVRNTGDVGAKQYIIVPFYELEHEGRKVDHGYEACGTLVSESMENRP